ncbi:MAG TPA: DUF5615 family PIN-like protein [Vicinamibacterales bacterium]|nr:DUF5615 family PIN-like protein [Vicinamibacterales bacterium]
MRVLLDECIPRRLKRELVGHDVKTAPEMGWASKKNGELLALAAVEFDILLTSDRNLSHQQNLSAFDRRHRLGRRKQPHRRSATARAARP